MYMFNMKSIEDFLKKLKGNSTIFTHLSVF